jgi:predicted acylesterase/phospholipase RssA
MHSEETAASRRTLPDVRATAAAQERSRMRHLWQADSKGAQVSVRGFDRETQKLRRSNVAETERGQLMEQDVTLQRINHDVEVVTDEVYREVIRARQLHRGMNSLHESYAVILEELDEFWEQVKVNPKKLSPEAQQVRMEELRKELIQTAAMCVRSILDLKL